MFWWLESIISIWHKPGLWKDVNQITVPVMLCSFDFESLLSRLPLPASFDNTRIRSLASSQDASGSSFSSSLSFPGVAVLDFFQFHLFYVCMFLSSHSLCVRVWVWVCVCVCVCVMCGVKRQKERRRKLREVGIENRQPCAEDSVLF